jgi:hypothetical protein
MIKNENETLWWLVRKCQIAKMKNLQMLQLLFLRPEALPRGMLLTCFSLSFQTYLLSAQISLQLFNASGSQFGAF